MGGHAIRQPSVRIERLEEALTIIESMWANKTHDVRGQALSREEAPLKIEMPWRAARF